MDLLEDSGFQITLLTLDADSAGLASVCFVVEQSLSHEAKLQVNSEPLAYIHHISCRFCC